MNTNPASDQSQPEPTDLQIKRQAAVGLLQGVLARLLDLGFQRAAIDRYEGHGYCVTHSYAGGEWTLRVQRPDPLGHIRVVWDYRHTLPSIDAIISDIGGPTNLNDLKKETAIA